MAKRPNRRFPVYTIYLVALAVFASAPAGAQSLPRLKPLCESERDVAGWTVAASLTPDNSGSAPVRRWSASKRFSSKFEFGVFYDSIEARAPALRITHNFESGVFAMQLPDRTSFSVPLRTDYSVTTANVPSEVIAYLRAAPALIEHRHSGAKSERYMTDGLPEALAAAVADLDLLEAQREEKGCSVHKGWRRITG